MMVSWRVESGTNPVLGGESTTTKMEDCWDEPIEVASLDELIKDLHRRHGTLATVEIMVWRENWSA